MAKKKKERRPGPVPNGLDLRARQPENDGSGLDGKPCAPDGVSGSWQ
ncbi:MAG: hypothetical protein IJ594_07385 [Oscillospiraceae bacterium]|nr:hypothetical protein [Oscillospiraceae bacterium]